MIKSLKQVMLYVEKFNDTVEFFTEDLRFVILDEMELVEGFKSVTIAPSIDNETEIVLFDKKFIKKYSPEVSLETPSLMFNTTDIDKLYTELKAKEITVSELVDMQNFRVFNFSDREGNYFAVSELNQ
ncbi:lactoylglutathione lyase [Phocicoccus schoeneichii]|uniref:Glyoxalase-like domain protein n=1 Tax=Phocicoccus schoeneichii TaxID=1812261 RepID=A0A6V7REC4_9BACL|nr:VOC family protein [Jeotgalicoccus schoeneichii]GGH56058.1 lactoylglutathione lyase [Jeotgalicoccus schoeneichii]CAD2075218.1 Glyoxalase-like domain protein [Jeotgalicoccus schoeneichii]